MEKPKLERKLRLAGISEDDIQCSRMLAVSIARMHRVAFGEDSMPSITTFTGPSEGMSFACYFPAADEYGIRAQRISRRIDEERKRCRPAISDSEKFLPAALCSSYRSVAAWFSERMKAELSREEICFLIALHEVRHRMQVKQAGLRMFAPQSEGSDHLADQCMLLVSNAFEKARRRYAANGKPQAEIERRIDSLEFDACVVDRYALHRFHPRLTVREVRNLLFLSPR